MAKANALKSHKTFGGLTQFWEHESESTKTKMKFSTFIPSQKPKGALIWLSGLTCTDENFITKAGAQRYLEQERLMVLCPDTSPRGLNLPQEHDAYDFGSGAGFYVNASTPGYRDHYRMYDYVSQEITSILKSQFLVASEKISISGHSMGGHGALILGLKEVGKFRSVSAFSPIVNPINCAWGQKAFKGYLGEDQDTWNDFDATELLKSGSRFNGEILIDQGSQDEFLEKGQLLTVNLENAAREVQQAAAVNYREGYDHSYYFISSFIENHIRHHSKALS